MNKKDKKGRKKVKYIVEVPNNFVEFCIKNAKDLKQLKKLEEILGKQKVEEVLAKQKRENKEMPFEKQFKEELIDWLRRKRLYEVFCLIFELTQWAKKQTTSATNYWDCVDCIDCIEQKIKETAQKTGKSEESILNFLFNSENAKIWMIKWRGLDTLESFYK